MYSQIGTADEKLKILIDNRIDIDWIMTMYDYFYDEHDFHKAYQETHGYWASQISYEDFDTVLEILNPDD